MLINSALLTMGLAATLGAGTVSFTGTFLQDDGVALMGFSVAPGASHVVIRTLSYAGGGFDPYLAVFNAAGLLLAQNDNGQLAVPADAVTGFRFDAFLDLPALPGGNYLLALTEANNFANGPTLQDGFSRAGEGNFTGADMGVAGSSFLDIAGNQRTPAWAVDLAGVEAPEPATLSLAGAGLLALWLRARRRLTTPRALVRRGPAPSPWGESWRYGRPLR
jgi:hypothetical protein